jgi:hypothetical protein
MAHRRLVAACAALVVVGFSVPAAAQGAPAPGNNKVVPTPAKADIERATFNFQVLMSALHSDKVEAPIKSALFACIYENSMGKISQAVDGVITANPGKIDKTNPTQVLGVMSGVCGYRPPAAGAAPAPSPAPTPPPPKR